MSYDLVIWRERPGTRADPAYTYCLISEDVEAPDLDPSDWSGLREALDDAYSDWRGPEGPFICDFSASHVMVSVRFSVADKVVPALTTLAQRLGLTVFDPQGEKVPPAVAKKARRDARAWRDRELKEHRAAEIAELKARARAGDVRAQLEYGNRLSAGDGVRQNLKEAFVCYKGAAESGSVDAMFNLAACFRHGDGTPRDMAESTRWYEKAAGTDRTYATFALGDIFLGCGPILRDDAKAKAYFSEALQNGHPDADAALRLLDDPDITIEKKKKAWKFAVPRE